MTSASSTRESALDFLGRVLETPDLAREYPLVFDASFGGATVELVEEGEIVAACGILERNFRVGARTLRGGLIGSVATEPEKRGRGLGTRLLAEAEKTLLGRGCTFALLWADRADFYLERGYLPFGVECDTMLVSELARDLPAAAGVRELRAGDEDFLHRIHAEHLVRVERTPEEMRALLSVPGMSTLVLERCASPTHPALPVAYACLGRGRDLPDAIHEWGGAVEDVLALLRAHLERRFSDASTGALFLMAPASSGELGYRLLRLGAVSRRGILGLGKLLDDQAAAQLLEGALGQPDSVALEGDALLLRGPSAGTRVERSALPALLFGGPEVQDEVHTLLERLGFGAQRLPLEPFAFGLDSI